MGIENPELLSRHAEVYVDPELKSGKSSEPISDPELDELQDLEALAERETGDGPGMTDTSELPPSDFVSFATEGVEKETD